MAIKMAFIDWHAMKYYHLRGILLPIITIFIGLFTSPLLVMPTSVLLCLFFSLNPFAVEEKGMLNHLYLTLPVDRNDIVSGRFILAGIMGVYGTVSSIPIIIISNLIGLSHYYLPLSWYVFILTTSYFLFSFFNLVTYPILFKQGYNKGKFWGVVFPAIFLGVIYGIFTGISHMPGNEALMFNLLEYAYKNMLLVNGIIVVFSTVLLIISFTLSKHFYSKRNF